MRAVIRQFAISVGMNEADDPKTMAPGALTTLVNGLWRKGNRIDKRFGTEGLTKNIVGGGTLGAAARLIVRGAELAVTTGSKLYSYTSSGWIDRGRHPELGLEWSTAIDPIDGVQSADAAVLSNGQIVEAWVSGDAAASANGTLYFQIREFETGVVISPPTSIQAGVNGCIRVIASGTTWHILFMSAGSLITFGSGGQFTLRTGGLNTAAAALDAFVVGSDFIVAFATSGGNYRLSRFTLAGAPPTETVTTTVTGETAAVNAISITATAGEKLYVGYFVAGVAPKIRYAIFDPTTLGLTFSPQDLESSASLAGGTVGIVRESSTSALLVYSVTGGSYSHGLSKAVSISSVGAITAGQSVQFMRHLSRPFAIGSRFYCVVATDILATRFLDAPVNSDTFLADVTREGVAGQPFREVGKIDCLIGGCWRRGYVSEAIAVSSTVTVLALGYQATPASGRTGSDLIGIRQGVRLVRCLSGASLPADMWRSVQLGDEVYLSAGVLTSYDGVEALGYGWPHGPYLVTFADQGSGGSMATGNYLYNTTAERRSAAGVLHRSPVGIVPGWQSTPPGVSVTGGPSGSVALGIVAPLFGHSTHIPGHFPYYRSTVGGTVLHRIAIEPSFMTHVDAGGLTYPISLTDTSSDTSLNGGLKLATRPALYTEGGELEDTQPVATLTVVLHRNRLFALAGDGRSVWVTKDSSSNPGVAPGFHPTQLVLFPERVVALASMDDKFVALSATRPYYLVGDGPDLTGQQSDYGSPTAVQSDVGCSSARSVVGMPEGVMFLTARGFYLLDRGLQMHYVGAAVQDTIDAFPNVTSGVLVPKQNQVRWTCNSADGSSGRVIVFDYVTKQWAVFSYWDGDAAVAGTPIADAVMWDEQWTFVTPNGKVYIEDESTHRDDGTTWVKQSGELAWLGEGGPLGFQHIRRAFLLGDRYTDCDFTLKFGFNHAASYAQSYTWTSDKLAQLGDGVNVGMRVGSQNGASPRCRAFRVSWEDAAPTGLGAVVGTGQGFNLSAIGLEFIPKPDMDRRSARART